LLSFQFAALCRVVGFCGQTNMDLSIASGFVDMKYEQNRFNTFVRNVSWGNLERYKKFAKAGFRFQDGEIICHVCNLSLGPTFEEEDVFGQHKLRNPYCLFVRGVADNAPMREDVSLFL